MIRSASNLTFREIDSSRVTPKKIPYTASTILVSLPKSADAPWAAQVFPEQVPEPEPDPGPGPELDTSIVVWQDLFNDQDGTIIHDHTPDIPSTAIWTWYNQGLSPDPTIISNSIRNVDTGLFDFVASDVYAQDWGTPLPITFPYKVTFVGKHNPTVLNSIMTAFILQDDNGTENALYVGLVYEDGVTKAKCIVYNSNVPFTSSVVVSATEAHTLEVLVESSRFTFRVDSAIQPSVECVPLLYYTYGQAVVKKGDCYIDKLRVATVPLTYYVYDTFTDTLGTGLENHVGEIGATWTYRETSAPASVLQIKNNSLIRPMYGDTGWVWGWGVNAVASGELPADFDLEFSFEYVGVSSTEYTGLWFDTLVGATPTNLVAVSVMNGGDISTADNTTALFNFQPNVVYTILVTVRETQIKVYLDGVFKVEGFKYVVGPSKISLFIDGSENDSLQIRTLRITAPVEF